MKTFGRRSVMAGLAAAALGGTLRERSAMAARTDGAGLTLRVVRKLRHDGVLSVAWSPDGSRLVSAGGQYTLWNPHTGEKLHELTAPWATPVPEGPVRFTADGRHVVAQTFSTKIDGFPIGFGLWNVETGQLDLQSPFPRSYFSQQRGGGPWFMPIPGRQQAVLAYGKDPGEPVLIYDTATWRVVDVLLRIPEGSARCFDLSPDGHLLAIGTRRSVPFVGEPIGRIDLYDLAGGKLVRRIEGAHKWVPHHLSFSSDGRLLASGSWEVGLNTANRATGQLEPTKDPDPVRVWEVSTGRKVTSFDGPFPGVSNLEFHPMHPWLAASLGTITGQTKGPEFRIWNWQSGALLTTQGQFNASAQHIAFSPDGRMVAMAGNQKGLWAVDRIEIAEVIAN